MSNNQRGSVVAETAMVLPTLLLITTLLLSAISAVNVKIKCEQVAANVARALEREEPHWSHMAQIALPSSDVSVESSGEWTTVRVRKELRWGIEVEGKAVALLRPER